MKTWLQWVSTGPMLSVSLILPTQNNGWLCAPPTELCNYQHQQQQQQQQQNFINKQNPQLARIFKAGQCVQNIKIETKTINIIILSRSLIQLSSLGKLRTRYVIASQSL